LTALTDELIQGIGLVSFIAVCFIASGIGSWLTFRSILDWYPLLRKPKWNPPNKVFGPVWTILYLLMAVAAWLVWREVGIIDSAIPLTLFFVQLVLNVAWSSIFFGMKKLRIAFYEILVLWSFILLTIIAFWFVTLLAAVLLLPYLVWVTFASILNHKLWKLNPTPMN